MDGLVIRSPWVEMILNGKKIWEIRGSYTHVRGKIGLIRGGSGKIGLIRGGSGMIVGT